MRKYREVPEEAHEWVSFEDPEEERIWMFDVTFLLSGWTCIFGRGCQGVLTGPAEELVQGCCSYGAHISDEEDQERVAFHAKRLRPEHWQFYKEGQKGIFKTLPSGEIQTRLVKDACIFLNRPGSEQGPGCAFHVAAADAGESYVDWKPEVCWQLPLHRADEVRDDGWVVSTISQWDRHFWGEGGEDFHWWCTEAPEAFVDRKPVYVTMRDELLAMIGTKVYAMLSTYLEKRNGRTAPLEHPAVR